MLGGLACAAAPAPVQAGAWLQEDSRTQIIFAATALDARGSFDRRGRPRRTVRFSKQETALQGERGIGDGLTLLAGVGARSASTGSSPHGAITFSGAVLAGVRARLWSDGASILSLQATGAAGMERSRPARLRAMEAPGEVEARLLYGKGGAIKGIPIFAEAQIGYRWRGGGNPDEIVLDATLGARLLPRLMLLLQSFNAIAVQPDRRFGGGAMRSHKLQPSLVWEISDGWSLQFGLFATVAGRSIPQERGLVAALWRCF